MPSYVTPKKNTAYIGSVTLVDQALPNKFKINPTLAAGDVKVSIDGGALNNLTTLPVVTPAGSGIVKFSLSAAEMNGDRIDIYFADAAGDEWADAFIPISTTLNQIDDLSTFNPATDAVANVTLVATCTTNTDMRGTDSANTTAPDNAGIAAVKAKTDQLAFTKANEIDSNIKSVNGVTVTGTGATGSEWGP